MEKRKEDLNKLKSYTNEVDKDLTMLLQILQWDRKHIQEHSTMTTCKYDPNHKLLANKLEEHQLKCLLLHNGYTKNDQLLPDPLDSNANTLIKLRKEDIVTIIDNASKPIPIFKKGVGSGDLEPLTIDRLYSAYSSDERRAIHDAVVSASPSCHDLADLALPSTGDSDGAPNKKTRMEILAELRDMRRRRTKYRVAAKSRNYSDVLRDVIKTQMELYIGIKTDIKTDIDEDSVRKIDNENSNIDHRVDNNDIKEHGGESSRGYSSSRSKEDWDRERSNRDNRHRERKEYDRKEHENADRRNKDEYKQGRHRKDEYSYYNRSSMNRHYDDVEKDRQNNTRGKYKMGSSESNRKDKLDRESRQDRFKEENDDHRNRDRNRHEKRRSKDRYDVRRRDLSDKERARNLIMEIKSEIESDEKDEAIRSTYPGSSFEVKQEKRYRDTAEKHHHIEESDKNNSHNANSVEREIKTRRGDSREGRDKRKKRHRDKSRDREAKRFRTEDKHRIYNEIYSELNNKRIK